VEKIAADSVGEQRNMIRGDVATVARFAPRCGEAIFTMIPNGSLQRRSPRMGSEKAIRSPSSETRTRHTSFTGLTCPASGSSQSLGRCHGVEAASTNRQNLLNGSAIQAMSRTQATWITENSFGPN